MRRPLLLSLLALAGPGACATASGEAPERHTFVYRPSRPPDCEFEVLEDGREPPRPYTVLGTMPFHGNEWLGTAGRKERLRETACRAGADAVLLSGFVERKLGTQRLREYEARFISYAPAPVEPEPPPPPPLPPGAVRVPTTGAEWPEETYGTSVREAPPKSE
jgi:hypothetical protein